MNLASFFQTKTKQKLIKKYGYNALHLAVYFDTPEEIAILEAKEILVKERNFFDMTPKHLALWLQREKCLNNLEQAYKKIFTVEKEGICQQLSIKEFEAFFQIKYLPHICAISEKFLHKVGRSMQKAFSKKNITNEEKWLGIYFEKELVQDENPDLKIQWIDYKKGFGVFADQDIKKKKWVGQYSGQLRSAQYKKDQKNAYCFEYIIHEKFEKKFTIDAKDQGNISRFINHSYTPNLTPSLVYLGGLYHIVFFAGRAIQKGEELTYNYGPAYWQLRETPNR